MTTLQGMSMTCPDGWHDKSMLIFSAPQAGQSGVVPNLVVTRDRLPDDLPAEPAARMEALIDRQIAQMNSQLARFTIVSRQLEGQDYPIGKLTVDWESAQAALTQSLTFVDGDDGQLVIATATTGREDHARHEDTFRSILQSFRIG
ncbi:MAG: DcrB-related protein [Sphingomonas sp.]